jgi:hypothetical protein
VEWFLDFTFVPLLEDVHTGVGVAREDANSSIEDDHVQSLKGKGGLG